jgi:hypothetical protein
MAVENIRKSQLCTFLILTNTYVIVRSMNSLTVGLPPFLRRTNVPEELDLTDEEIEELLEINEEHGRRERSKKEEELHRLATSDAEKVKNKAITETLRGLNGGKELYKES